MDFSFIAELLRALSRLTLYQIQEMSLVQLDAGIISFSVYFYPDFTFVKSLHK